jgi:hypothetical protein
MYLMSEQIESRPVDGGTEAGETDDLDEALSLLREAGEMIEVAHHRLVEFRQSAREMAVPAGLKEARGLVQGALHRIVDAIADLERESPYGG